MTPSSDPIDLGALPHESQRRRARAVLAAVARGAHPCDYGGKPLRGTGDIIRVKIGRRYRLLFRRDDVGFHPLRLISHEEYNGVCNDPRRLRGPARLYNRR